MLWDMGKTTRMRTTMTTCTTDQPPCETAIPEHDDEVVTPCTSWQLSIKKAGAERQPRP